MKKRILTVSSISSSTSSNDTKSFPMIRLSGKWLRELGFEEGYRIEICENSKELVIKLL